MQAPRSAPSSPSQLSNLGPRTDVVSDTAVHCTQTGATTITVAKSQRLSEQRLLQQTGADNIVMAKSERLNSLNSCEVEAFAAAAASLNS